MTEPILTLEDVHTHVGLHHILQGVTFEVTAGRSTVLLGRNGSGKSTLLNTISGLMPITHVNVEISSPGYIDEYHYGNQLNFGTIGLFAAIIAAVAVIIYYKNYAKLREDKTPTQDSTKRKRRRKVTQRKKSRRRLREDKTHDEVSDDP